MSESPVSPYKNISKAGNRVVSFWLTPPLIKFLDKRATVQHGGNRTEALRAILFEAQQRSKDGAAQIRADKAEAAANLKLHADRLAELTKTERRGT